MSNEVTVKISGLDELQRKLQEELPKDAKLALRIALNAGGGDIKKAAQAEAPVEADGPDSGFLKDHIKVKVKLRRDELAGSALIGPTNELYPSRVGKQGQVSFKTATGKKISFMSKHAGGVTAAMVGRFLEFGTRHITPRAWLTRAWGASKQQALDHVIAKLKEGLKL
jgi:HK97 gp10 family phage protein